MLCPYYYCLVLFVVLSADVSKSSANSCFSNCKSSYPEDIAKIQFSTARSGDNHTCAHQGNTVLMHYTMYLQNGDTYVDSSRNRTKNQFKVGSNQVFRGIDLGIQCMSVGERANLTIPPTLAFGCNKMYENEEDQLIPSNSTLILDVELLKVT